MLIHYTAIENVASILQHGLLLVPNRRNLAQKFMPDIDFTNRDPQQFGMTSFTELPVEYAKNHRSRFGNLGIAVSNEWARRNGAQRVLYVGDNDGVVFDTFKWLFQLACQEVKATWPEKPFPAEVLKNRVIAGLYGGQLYSRLLNLYEFMEPAEHSDQTEWRIINSLPRYYDLTHGMQVAVTEMLAMVEQGDRTCAARLTPNDVEMIFCSISQLRHVRKTVPAAYRRVPIVPYDHWMGAIYRIVHQWAAKRSADRTAEHRVNTNQTVSTNKENLPRIKHINGLLICPDQVLERANVDVEFIGVDDKRYSICMPFIESVRLAIQLGQGHTVDQGRRLLALSLAALKEDHDLSRKE